MLYLFLAQSLLFAFYLAGVMNAETTASFYALGYLLFRLFLHVRVAVSTLGLPLGAGMALGLIPVFVDFLLIQLLP